MVVFADEDFKSAFCLYRDMESKMAIHRALRALKSMAIDQKFTSIAMPKLGAGFGGVDWLEVRGMMDSQLDELLFPIFVYVTELDGQVASEPGM